MLTSHSIRIVVEVIQPAAGKVRMCGSVAVRWWRRSCSAIGTIRALVLRGFHAVSGFDNIGLEMDRSRAAVEFEEESAGVAEY